MVLGKVKKLFKRAITITLATAMVVTSIPVSANAQELGQSTEEIVVETEETTVEETEAEEAVTVETAETEVVETEEATTVEAVETEVVETEEATTVEDAETEETGENETVTETEEVVEETTIVEETTEVETVVVEEIVSEEIVMNGNAVESNNAASDETVVYESDTVVTSDAIDFSELTEEDWGKKVTVTYAYTNDVVRTVEDKYTVDATVTIDATAYQTLETEGNYIKIQGIVKLNDWVYTKSDAVVELKASDFTKEGENYTTDIQFDYTDKAGTLMEVDFEIVGVGFKGAVSVDNVTVANVEKQAESYEDVVYENETSVASDAIDFSELTEEDWTKKATVTYAYTNNDAVNVIDKYRVDTKVTINETTYQTLGTEGNYVKIQGIVKINDWVYTKSDAVVELKAADFTKEGENYTADVQFEYTDKAGTLMEIDFEIVGVGFAGIVNFSDVKVVNITTEKPPLEEKDPTILSDLSTEADFNNWKAETGWDYYHGGTENAAPVIAYDNANQRLKVSLDYSANSASTWSEAKATFTPTEAADVSQYNQISVDFIYPDALDGTKMKFFAAGVIEKDTAIDESTAEVLADGMKKVTVTMSFSPTASPLESLTIGIIGVSTSFKGDVYFDNLVLSQKNLAEDFVEITSVPGEGSAATLTTKPSSIKLTDKNADDSVKALYTYLATLANDDQVLFGHQNDVNKQVNAAATLGDVHDITGQISGLYGIDTLALTGSEAGGTDAKSALENSVKYSKQAAENGAIVTLSAHMPNVSNSKVVKNEDGTYDFFQCDFNESKDLSNDIAKKILPGGEYNVVYNAYLDIIVDYATQLQEENIPIIFRPLHENTGNWFWWGSSNTAETYKSLFRYTRDYIESKGVHNMLWVYSPNGPLTTEEEYLSYYPGDEYIDILAFDYYDDYNTYPATSDGSFFTNLDNTCKVVASLAEKRGKVAAISECGVRVMKKDGSDNEGLLVKGNPVGTAASGTNWYSKINEIAQQNNMPYYLVWANFSDTNFYVPYKYNDTMGHELINDFIDFYNEESSIFGKDANFYANMATLATTTTETYTNQMGYMVSPFDRDTVLEPTKIMAVVENAEAVQFIVANTGVEGKAVTLDAAKVENAQIEGLWSADLTEKAMAEVGKTEVAAITLKADDVELAKITNIALGKEKEKAPAHIIENFDYYSGSDSLLDVSYTANSAAGCSSGFTLSTENKSDGTFGGAFNYKLSTTGSEVWTGRIKSDLVSGDFSKYNALEMWVKPDGMGQKVVIQLTDASGEEFEVYLTDFVKGTEAKHITIPFSSFKGKRNGTLDAANITKFAIWCNSIIPEGHEGTWEVDSAIYFDGIQAVKIADGYVTDENGLIIEDKLRIEFVDGQEYTYTGKAIIPEIKVYDGNTLLQENVDYKLKFSKNKAVGKAVVNVTGKGNYDGKHVTDFAIVAKDLETEGIVVDYKENLVETNKNQKALNQVTYTVDGKTTKLGSKDYTVTYYQYVNGVIPKDAKALKQIKKAGDYQMVVTGKGNFTGTVTKDIKVYAKNKVVDISKLTVKIAGKTSYSVVCDGTAQKPAIQVFSGGKEIGKECYEVSYDNNTNVGTAKITIKGKLEAGYIGSVTKTFKINATKLSNVAKIDTAKWKAKVDFDASIGEAKQADNMLIAKDAKSKVTFKEGTDYKVSYSKNTKAGKATVTYTGIGKYSGTIKKTFTVNAIELFKSNKPTAGVDISIGATAEYAQKGSKVDVVVSIGGTTLVEGKDYKVTYKNNKAVTTVNMKENKKPQVTIKGVNGYKGTMTAKFTITPTDLSTIDMKVADVAYQNKKGKYKSAPVLTDADNKKLKVNRDYTVKYYLAADGTELGKNDVVDAGESVKVVVTAKGKNYTGSNEAVYKVAVQDISKAKVVVKSKPYTGKAITLTAEDFTTIKVGDTKLKEGVHYEIVEDSYVNNVNKGTASVTIKGIGNYAGTKKVTFKITGRTMAWVQNLFKW